MNSWAEFNASIRIQLVMFQAVLRRDGNVLYSVLYSATLDPG